MLIFIDLAYRFGEVSEEAGVVYSNSCLVTEGKQQFTVLGDKQVGINTTVYINGTDTVIADNQGSAHDGANAIGHNAFLGLQSSINLCIVGKQGLPSPYYPIHRAATDFEGALINGAHAFITGNSELEFMGCRVYQH